MCGRFQLANDKDIEEINRILREISLRYSGTDMTAKTGEVYPTDAAAIINLSEGKPELSLMRWGFPKWDGKGVIFNVKSETASEKAMFSKMLRRQRCVIPSTGFYEWNGRKEKFLLNRMDDPMLYMAGIYDKENFSIFTREANIYIHDIHHRMPVVLQRDELEKWLADDSFIDYVFSRDDIVLERITA